jgi:hypothetical protein
MLAPAVARETGPTHPQNAPRAFATGQYGLTFRTPPKSTYCPLPSDWTGSDHGTTVFLTPPQHCGGAGFPSSSRGFSPDVPRIEIYYQYWMGEDFEAPRPRCHAVGQAWLFGQRRPLCRDSDSRMVSVDIYSRYRADVDAEVHITLITEPGRMDSDTQSLLSLSKSMRTCSSVWSDSRTKKTFVVGSGPLCPRDAVYF